MAYDPSDARSKLATADRAAVPTAFGDTSYVRFHDHAPNDQTPQAKVWWARGQNFVLGWVEVDGEFELSRTDQPDEFMVILPQATTTATFTANDESLDVVGVSLNVVPPGASSITVRGTGPAVFVFSNETADLLALAVNALDYADPKPNVAPLMPWPDPVDGFRLRTYDLSKESPINPMLRVYRTTNLMVNWAKESTARDISLLSPHSHDDFEQCSLVLRGEYVHHIRWPWTPDGRIWREDTHERIGAPSITVIQPPTVHTSQSMIEGPGANHLIDIFSPPRVDFSSMDGWVLNAQDYPMPSATDA